MQLNQIQQKKLKALINSLKTNPNPTLGCQHDNTSILGSNHVVMKFDNGIDLSEFVKKSIYSGNFLSIAKRIGSKDNHKFSIAYSTLAKVLKGNVKKSDKIKFIINDNVMKIETTQNSEEFKEVLEFKLEQDKIIDNLTICFNMQYIKRIVEVMKVFTDIYGDFNCKFDVQGADKLAMIESDNIKAYIAPIRLVTGF